MGRKKAGTTGAVAGGGLGALGAEVDFIHTGWNKDLSAMFQFPLLVVRQGPRRLRRFAPSCILVQALAASRNRLGVRASAVVVRNRG